MGTTIQYSKILFIRWFVTRLTDCVTQLNVFSAAIVLLLNIWGGKRTRMNLNPVKEMLDVHKCMQVLRDTEQTQVGF